MLTKKNPATRSGREHYRNQSSSPWRKVRPFESLDALMESALELIHACCAYPDINYHDADDYTRSKQKLNALALAFHKRLACTDDTNPFVRLVRSHALEPFEVEAVLALTISRLRLTNIDITVAHEISELLEHRQRDRLKLLRSLMPDGKLNRLGLIHIDKDDPDSNEGQLDIDHRVVEWFLTGREEGVPIRIAVSEEELYAWLREISQTIVRMVPELGLFESGNGTGRQVRRARRRFGNQVTDIMESLSLHPEWKLGKLRELAGDDRQHTAIVIALLCKALGYFRWLDNSCTGQMLAGVAQWDIEDPTYGYEAIGPRSPLIVNNIIRPIYGATELISSRPEELDDIEFELTEQSLEALALNKYLQHGRRGDDGISEPRLTLDQLVLSSKVRKALKPRFPI
ncbi:MAG: hypothetical protein GXY44_06545 [Phycisphaerales bacterium]|nr:hypothetical protein [Phycisphaerales bacterium]